MSAETPSKRVVIAGGSGFLGISLASHLTEAGFAVSILSRSMPKVPGPWAYEPWDARTIGDWGRVLDGALGVVNLVGRSVDCIKTPDHQDEILRSRIEATRVLGQMMRRVSNPPSVWVQMSTAHIYGDPPSIVCTEESPTGYGLAPDVGRAWEQEFQSQLLPPQRQVILRTGFVIGRNRGAGGGAIERLRMLARFGLGGTFGSGRQGMSWIHEVDLNRLIERSLVDQGMSGVYNATSPHPISQRELMSTLRRVIRMPLGLPSPEWLTRLGARWLLRTDPELAIYGRYVVSNRLAQSGFEFRFPHIGEALTNVLA